MKIVTLTVILGLPLMALGQQAEPQQTQAQTNETQSTAPVKKKKMNPAQQQSKPEAKSETDTTVRGQTKIKGHAPDANRTETSGRSSTSETTTVNKEEFRSRHSQVFNLGRHPKEFFVQRYGANHVHLIGNTYFVFLDGCWVSVDVNGFVYSQRVICPGDPDFIEVD